MAERGFGEPARLSRSEVHEYTRDMDEEFAWMEYRASERAFRERQLFFIGGIVLSIAVILGIVAVVVAVTHG